MDKWSDKNTCTMLVGGNSRAKAFFRQHGFDDMAGKANVSQRYSAPIGRRYAKLLAEEADSIKAVDAAAALFNSSQVSNKLLRQVLSLRLPCDWRACRWQVWPSLHKTVHHRLPGALLQ
jgi:hypothetical protein